MESVSFLSTICIVFSALVSVLLPFVYLIIGKKKMKGSILPALGAVLTFVLVFVVQAVLWSALDMDNVLPRLLGKEKSEAIIASIKCVYMAVIETAGMWLYFKAVSKKRKGFGNAVTFGSGYAICACFIYSVLLVLSVAVLIANAMGKEVSYTFYQMLVNNAKVRRDDVEFLFYGFRSLFDGLFYLGASVLMFATVQQKLKWPIPVVILLHVCHVLPAQMSPLKVWYWSNGIVVMMVVGIVAVITCLAAYKVYLDYYKVEKVKE